MYCYRCGPNLACSISGQCGTQPGVGALVETLNYGLQGLSMYASRNRAFGLKNKETDEFLLDVIFIDILNVNFDKQKLFDYISKLNQFKNTEKAMYLNHCREFAIPPEVLCGPAIWRAKHTLAESIQFGEALSVQKAKHNYKIGALKDLIINVLKGISFFTHQLKFMDVDTKESLLFIYKSFNFIATPDLTEEELRDYCYKCGEENQKLVNLLDDTLALRYGEPIKTRVLITPIKGKAILVLGNSITDLEVLLKQTNSKNINVYTYEDLSYAHSFPELKQFRHLVGTYGEDESIPTKEIEDFPGAIVVTANCLHDLNRVIRGRIFTTNVVSCYGVMSVSSSDFKPVINAAYDAEGFKETPEAHYVELGLDYNKVGVYLNKVQQLIERKKIEHVFIFSGDNREINKRYYNLFIKNLPKKSVVLKFSGLKYDFSSLEKEFIEDIPRVIDIGIANSSFAAIQLEKVLKDNFSIEISKLPLTLFFSWEAEQSLSILMNLVSFGVKKIFLGPFSPANVSPNVIKILDERFGITKVTNPKDDINKLLE